MTECVICRLCLSMKQLKHKIHSFLVRWCSSDIQLWDAIVVLQLVLGCFCFPYLLWIVVLVFWYCLQECLRGNVEWSFPGSFVNMCILLFLCFSSVVVGLVPHCGCIFSWVLTLFATVFVHRVVTSVWPLGELPKRPHMFMDDCLVCRVDTWVIYTE